VLSQVLIDYKVTLCWVPREVVPPTRIQNSCCHFCGQPFSIAGLWFQRQDIHRFYWASNDGHTWKEINLLLFTRGNMNLQCRVYCSFDIASDNFLLIATLKLKVKKASLHQNTCFIPTLCAVSKPAVRKLCHHCFLVT